ncbi:hypothetical protein [Planomicrobium sp. CPCC 101079]|nr:hypothetical protein [Planomicrobium sp. CPCC 101079]
MEQTVDAAWLQWNSSKEAIQFFEKLGCERVDLIQKGWSLKLNL